MDWSDRFDDNKQKNNNLKLFQYITGLLFRLPMPDVHPGPEFFFQGPTSTFSLCCLAILLWMSSYRLWNSCHRSHSMLRRTRCQKKRRFGCFLLLLLHGSFWLELPGHSWLHWANLQLDGLVISTFLSHLCLAFQINWPEWRNASSSTHI